MREARLTGLRYVTVTAANSYCQFKLHSNSARRAAFHTGEVLRTQGLTNTNSARVLVSTFFTTKVDIFIFEKVTKMVKDECPVLGDGKAKSDSKQRASDIKLPPVTFHDSATLEI